MNNREAINGKEIEARAPRFELMRDERGEIMRDEEGEVKITMESVRRYMAWQNSLTPAELEALKRYQKEQDELDGWPSGKKRRIEL